MELRMREPQLRIGRRSYRTFKYLAGFVSEWARLGLDDDDLRELEMLILSSPDAGQVMAGTGGLRKIRFSPSRWHRGKSGALRIGYAHDAGLEKVLVLAVYAKKDKANLTPLERREIKRVLELLWRDESR
jgi:hypothetical protein